MKVSFARALCGTCRGVQIFRELKDQSLGRAFFHHLLILLLAALVITCGVLPGIQRMARRTAEGIHEACYGFVFSKDGLKPEREFPADRHPVFLLPGKTKVEYFPEISDDLIPTERQGIFWFPRQILYYEQIPGKRYTVRWYDPNAGKLLEEDVEAKAFAKMARKVPPLDWDPEKLGADRVGNRLLLLGCSLLEPELAGTLAMDQSMDKLIVPEPVPEPVVLYPGKVMRLFRLYSPWFMAIGTWLMLLFQTTLYLLMFTGISWLFWRGRTAGLAYRQLLVLAIYAGFPALVIAGVGSSLQLPWVGEFQLVYVIGMTFYLLTVIRKLGLLRPAGPSQPGAKEE